MVHPSMFKDTPHTNNSLLPCVVWSAPLQAASGHQVVHLLPASTASLGLLPSHRRCRPGPSAESCGQHRPVSAEGLQPWTTSGAGSLLDHIGGYVNPLRLIRRIPEGMAIARLRDRIVQIVADFRTQTSLREGCNTILHTDCVLLAQVGGMGNA